MVKLLFYTHIQSGTSDLLSGLTVNDMASALSSSSTNKLLTNPPATFTADTSNIGMGPSQPQPTLTPSSNQTPSPQISRLGFQQTPIQQQPSLLQPTPLQPTQTQSQPLQPAQKVPLQPSLTSTLQQSTFMQNSSLQPSKYTAPPKQTPGAISTGTGMQSRYTPPAVRSQQAAGGSSGLGDTGLFTGRTGQTSQTGFGGSSGGSLGGILQPTNQMPQQSGLTGVSGLGSSDYRSSTLATSGSLFSGMQVGGGGGGGGYTPPSQVKRSMINSSSGGGGSGSSSGGIFSGMQQPVSSSNQPMQGGSGGGGLLQPLVPMQQQTGATRNVGNASAGWSSNIDTQLHQVNTLYGSAQPQSQATGAGWSSNIAGSSSMSSRPTAAGSEWSQNVAPGVNGMGIQPMQAGMGHPSMQSGVGMGQGNIGGVGATWSSNIAGGNTNMGYHGASVSPTATGPLMSGIGQPLVPQSLQPQQQFQTANKPAPGANPFADLNFLA